MPCLRHTSATFIPASCSRSTPMICSSVNRLRFIRPSPSGSRTLLIPGGVLGAQVNEHTEGGTQPADKSLINRRLPPHPQPCAASTACTAHRPPADPQARLHP